MREVAARLGVSRSTVHERFFKSGRLRPVVLGPRSIGCLEDEVDEVIDQLAAARDSTARPKSPRRRTGKYARAGRG